MRNEEKIMRGALIANAIFSFLSSLVFIIFPTALAQLMSLAHPNWLVYIGIGLIVFAIIILLLIFRPKLNPRHVKLIIYADWAWVIGSMLLILLDPLHFSLKGLVLVAMIAMVVATLAIWQGKALKNL